MKFPTILEPLGGGLARALAEAPRDETRDRWSAALETA
jgi:hypothetical protein